MKDVKEPKEQKEPNPEKEPVIVNPDLDAMGGMEGGDTSEIVMEN